MKQKMAESGRDFTWNSKENPLLMTPEERELAAQAAVVGSEAGSSTDLYTMCVTKADDEPRIDVFAKLFAPNVKPYSK